MNLIQDTIKPLGQSIASLILFQLNKGNTHAFKYQNS